MSQQELLDKVTQTLDTLGIDYMITGSIASSMQGEPRLSHDIDLVIHLPVAAVPALLKAFPDPEFYLSEESVREALRQRRMFNLLHVADGDKVDFWILTDEPFDQARFARKRVEEFQGMWLKVSSPEDTILKKLSWSKLLGGSEKQLTDALRVFEVQRDKLDLEYVRHWSAQLGIGDLWQQLLQQAKPVQRDSVE
jgi:hypothetical protein